MPGVGGVIDVVALAVIGLAVLRGLWIGMLREAFSLAALATAVFAFRALRSPVADEIAMRTHWDPLIATAAAGGLVVITALLFVSLVGAIVRRLVSSAGLSFFDRLAGAAVGAAEGALLVGLALFGATEIFGAKDPLFTGSRAVAIFQSFAKHGEAPDLPASGAFSEPKASEARQAGEARSEPQASEVHRAGRASRAATGRPNGPGAGSGR